MNRLHKTSIVGLARKNTATDAHRMERMQTNRSIALSAVSSAHTLSKYGACGVCECADALPVIRYRYTKCLCAAFCVVLLLLGRFSNRTENQNVTKCLSNVDTSAVLIQRSIRTKHPSETERMNESENFIMFIFEWF